VVLRRVEQEGIVAVRREDLGVRDIAAGVDQRLDDLAGASARARSPPVASAGSK